MLIVSPKVEILAHREITDSNITQEINYEKISPLCLGKTSIFKLK